VRERLGPRKLNANHYNEQDGQIWHVPGFGALSHQCQEVAQIGMESERPENYYEKASRLLTEKLLASGLTMKEPDPSATDRYEVIFPQRRKALQPPAKE